MFATTTIMLSLALAAAAQSLNVNDFDARNTRIAGVVDARKAEIDNGRELELISNLCTEFALADCEARNGRVTAANGDVETVRGELLRLLLDGANAKHGELATLATAVADAKADGDAEKHQEAVNEFAEQLDDFVADVATRSELLLEAQKTFADNAETQLQAALEAARTRIGKFAQLDELKIELAALIAEANAAKQDNSAIGATQKEIAQKQKDFKADIDAIKAILVDERLALVKQTIADKRAAAVEFRLDGEAAEAEAEAEAASEAEEDEVLTAEEAARRDVHLVHAVLKTVENLQQVQAAVDTGDYPDVALATFNEGKPEVTYEVVCAADHGIDATENQSCEEQIANLAADTETEWQTANVLNQLDVDVAEDVIVNKKNQGWEADPKWEESESTAKGGYGGGKDSGKDSDEDSSDEEDSASLFGLSFAAIAAAFALRL